MQAARSKLLAQIAPALAGELLDAILVWRVRLTRPIISPLSATKHLQALNVLPRTVAPLTTRAVLAAKPWIHLESLVPLRDMWLIKSLLLLSMHPHNHPLQFDWERVIAEAVRVGDVSFLEWWYKQQFPIGTVFDPEPVCKNGNVAVLDWAKSAGLDVLFSEQSVQSAIRHGHVAVLDWIEIHHNGGSTLIKQVRDNADNVVLAVGAGHMSLVRWLRQLAPVLPIARQITKGRAGTSSPLWGTWLLQNVKAAGGPVDLHHALTQGLLPPRSVVSAFLLACAAGNVEALNACFDWLTADATADAPATGSSSHSRSASRACLVPNRNQRSTHLAYLYASAAGHVHVLDWLKNHGFVPLTVIAPGRGDAKASDTTHVGRARLRDEHTIEEHLLSHFVPHAHEWIHVHSALDYASIMGHVHVLDWWLAMRDVMAPMDFDYTPLAINSACRLGNAKVVAWWIASNLPLKYSCSSVLSVPASLGHVAVLQVWRASKIESLKWDPAMLTPAAQNGQVNVLKWWAKEWTVDTVRSAIQESIGSYGDARVIEWYLDYCGLNLRQTHRGSVGQVPPLAIQLSISSPPLMTPSTSIGSHSSTRMADCQSIREQLSAIQRLAARYPALPLKPLTMEQVTILAKCGCAALIKYFGTRGLLPQDIDLDCLAESDNCVPTMNWLVFSQTKGAVKHSEAALVKATKAGSTAVLTWWARSSPPLTFKTSPGLDQLLKNDESMDAKTAAWWKLSAKSKSAAPACPWLVSKPSPVEKPAKPIAQRKKLCPRGLIGDKESAASGTGASVDNLTLSIDSMTMSVSTPSALAP